MIGYFEDEAVNSYTEYLNMVETGKLEDSPAPTLAINYYKLAKDAKLSDVIKCVRADEQHHSKTNHEYANNL
jgi:ubiquinol oxidase